jgi:hypothetical protein
MSGDLSRLPKWAQNEIRLLRREVTHWKERASVGPDDSNVFAHPYSQAPLPLGLNADVEYDLGDFHLRISVTPDHAGLSVMSTGSHGFLSVRPQASNVVEIREEKR